MKKSVMQLLASLIVMGLLLIPAISGADPGNDNGNGNAGGNGNHYAGIRIMGTVMTMVIAIRSKFPNPSSFSSLAPVLLVWQ